MGFSLTIELHFAKCIASSFGQDDFVLRIAGDTLAHFEQSSVSIVIKPFVIFVCYAIDDLFDFGLDDLPVKIVPVRNYLDAGGIQVRYGLYRVIVVVVIYDRGQPLVCFNSKNFRFRPRCHPGYAIGRP